MQTIMSKFFNCLFFCVDNIEDFVTKIVLVNITKVVELKKYHTHKKGKNKGFVRPIPPSIKCFTVVIFMIQIVID